MLKNLGHVKEFRQRVQLSSTLLLLLQISSCRKRQTEDGVSRHNMALGENHRFLRSSADAVVTRAFAETLHPYKSLKAYFAISVEDERNDEEKLSVLCESSSPS